MFMLMRMLMVGDPTGEVVNVYANAYARGWDPNGEKLSVFRLMRMLVVEDPMGKSCQCLG